MFGRLLFLLSVIILFKSIYGIPRRRNEPWTLILCKFADLPYYEPKPPEYFRQWLTEDKNDSIERYFSDVSNGVYTINGSNVVGWITLPYSQKDVLRMVNADSAAPIGSDTSFDASFFFHFLSPF
uniref:Uncharacterized protein n=1 Tax=Panagrolaimus superbus TaxID=310955 RepID=A0A914YV57_9BILA